VRTRDDVGGDEFADPVGRFGSGFHGGFDAADVPFDENGQKAAAEVSA